MKSWYLSLQALLSDCPDGFLPMEWVLLCMPSTPSTSTRTDNMDLRSKSSALFQLDRRDPPRRDEVSLPTVRCCWCCCTGLRRKDSSRDIFTVRRPSLQLGRWQRQALVLCDSSSLSAHQAGPRTSPSILGANVKCKMLTSYWVTRWNIQKSRPGFPLERIVDCEFNWNLFILHTCCTVLNCFCFFKTRNLFYFLINLFIYLFFRWCLLWLKLEVAKLKLKLSESCGITKTKSKLKCPVGLPKTETKKTITKINYRSKETKQHCSQVAFYYRFVARCVANSHAEAHTKCGTIGGNVTWQVFLTA